MSFADEIAANLERAVATLQAANVLFAANFLTNAASRADDAAFHAAAALLLSAFRAPLRFPPAILHKAPSSAAIPKPEVRSHLSHTLDVATFASSGW